MPTILSKLGQVVTLRTGLYCLTGIVVEGIGDSGVSRDAVQRAELVAKAAIKCKRTIISIELAAAWSRATAANPL